MDEGLGKRLFDFAVRIIKFCRTLPRGKEYEIIKYQLVKSATSSGSNYSTRQIKYLKDNNWLKIKVLLLCLINYFKTILQGNLHKI